MSNRARHDATKEMLAKAIQARLDYLIDCEVDIDCDGDHTDPTVRNEMNALAAVMLMLGFPGNRTGAEIARQSRILRMAFDECAPIQRRQRQRGAA